MSEPAPGPDNDKGVAELLIDVSEKTSALVREEIELAKTEITEKVSKLLKGGAVGAAAGVFAFLGLILLMHAIAWLLVDLFFDPHVWLGFMVEAIIFFIVAAIAGLVAYKAVQAGSPPTPDLAIEEGKRIRATLQPGTTPPPKEPAP